MNVGGKVSATKKDFVQIVTMCNEAGEYRLANQAQAVLHQLGAMSDALAQKPATKIFEAEIKQK